MDATDSAILAALMGDAKVPLADLGKQLSIAPSTVFKRIERMKQEGVIERFTIAVNPEFFPRRLVAFLSIKVDPGAADDLIGFLQQKEVVREVFEVLEPNDYLVKTVTADTSELKNDLIYPLSALPGVREVNTILAVKKIKEQTYVG
ncbi:MAG: Lrp/AsnC family transcriptional regulator [Methanocalculus sp. MSAO_Arc1]|uniref:Lrp/AsnC family transcriptional regulator n=1 Tax=Methanocalculus TaxID=71151 RepID=UPI000FF6B99A|nr:MULTISPECIES: Lrp/AsnC family transcriptional regulator [unclassified Methanocalculus]MCP1661841.1 Lrp/AsnC family transcriptional regulator for asnA, asnC and gidA/Lrp/AsnC family leucine-responsive transcriptional regulator [Methanocalculus sp. AMF5]RQD81974.1 MAG: Lrp/AsnC family transcriptional regulator [Methanocalculus sp. MSAO_Arc1]